MSPEHIHASEAPPTQQPSSVESHTVISQEKVDAAKAETAAIKSPSLKTGQLPVNIAEEHQIQRSVSQIFSESQSPELHRSHSGTQLEKPDPKVASSFEAVFPGVKSTAPQVDEAPLPQLKTSTKVPEQKFQGDIEEHKAFRNKADASLEANSENLGRYEITKSSKKEGAYRLNVVVPDRDNPGKAIVKRLMVEKEGNNFVLKRLSSDGEERVYAKGDDLNQAIKEACAKRYHLDPKKVEAYSKSLISHDPAVIAKETYRELNQVLIKTWDKKLPPDDQIEAGQQFCSRLEDLKHTSNANLMAMRSDLSTLSHVLSRNCELDSPHKAIYEKALKSLEALERRANGMDSAVKLLNEAVYTERTNVTNMKNCLAVLKKFQDTIPEKDQEFFKAYLHAYEQAVDSGEKVCEKLEKATAKIRGNPPDLSQLESAMGEVKNIYVSPEGQDLLKAYAEVSLMHPRIQPVLEQVHIRKDPVTKQPVTIKQFMNREKVKLGSLSSAKSDPEILPAQRMAKYNLFVRDLEKAAGKMGNTGLKEEMEKMGNAIERIVTPMDVDLAFDSIGKISSDIETVTNKLKTNPNDPKLNGELRELMGKMRTAVCSCLQDQGEKLGKSENLIIRQQLQKVIEFDKAQLAKKDSMIEAGISRLRKKPSDQLVQSSMREIQVLQGQIESDLVMSRSLDTHIIKNQSRMTDPDSPEGKAIESENDKLFAEKKNCDDDIRACQKIITKLSAATDQAAVKLSQERLAKFEKSKPDATALEKLNRSLDEAIANRDTEKIGKIIAQVRVFALDLESDKQTLNALSVETEVNNEVQKVYPEACSAQSKLVGEKASVMKDMLKIVGEKIPSGDQQKSLDKMRLDANDHLNQFNKSVDTVNRLQMKGTLGDLSSDEKRQLKQALKDKDQALSKLRGISAELNQSNQIFFLTDKERSEIADLNILLNNPKMEEKAREIADIRTLMVAAEFPLKNLAQNFLDLGPKQQKIAELRSSLSQTNPKEIEDIDAGRRVIVLNSTGDMEVREAKGFDATSSKTMFTQMRNQEQVTLLSLQELVKNVPALEARKDQLNDVQLKFLKEVKYILEGQNPLQRAERAQEWVVKNRTTSEDKSAVPTGYNTAFTAESKPTFFNKCETGQLMMGHRIMAQKDPENARSYEAMAELISELKKASDAASPVLRKQYATDVKSDIKVIKDHPSTAPEVEKALENLRDKITILNKRLDEIQFNPTRSSEVGELSKIKFKEALKAIKSQIDALQHAIDVEKKGTIPDQKAA